MAASRARYFVEYCRVLYTFGFGSRELAYDVLRKHLDQHGFELVALDELVRIGLRLDRVADLNDIFDELLRENSVSVSLRDQYAKFLLATKRPQEAIHQAEELLKIAESQGKLRFVHYYGAAEIFRWAGESDRAIEHFRLALEQKPRSLEAFTQLIRGYAYTKRYEEAISILTSRPRFKGRFNEYFAALAECYFRTKKFGPALEAARESVKRHPCIEGGHQFLIGASEALGRFDESLDACDRAITAFPDEPNFQYRKAHLLLMAGRNPEARLEFDKAVARTAEEARDEYCEFVTKKFDELSGDSA